MSQPRQLHLWAFLQGIGHYPGGWRYRGAAPRSVFDAEYYRAIGALIERGRFDAIVFGDQLQGRGANGRTPERLAIPTLDPMTLLALIASTTSHVGLVATVSTTYNHPAALADRFATLDRLSAGRAGWNIVTTAHPASAWNFGEQALPDKATRYARAAAFVTSATRLWDSAQPAGEAPNPLVRHADDWFAFEHALAVPQTPQRRPVLVQAGQSGDGRDFAAATAEAIFCPARTLADGLAFRQDIRARMARAGRDPEAVRVMPGLSFVLAPTEAEAVARDEELLALADPEMALEYLGESLGFGLSEHDPAGPIPLAAILAGTEFPPADIERQLGAAVAAGTSLADFARAHMRAPRGHHVFRGTPEQMAAMMAQWLEAGACDGFTLQPAYMPGELEIFVDQVVPILQQRGLLRRDYAHTTLRGHLGLGDA